MTRLHSVLATWLVVLSTVLVLAGPQPPAAEDNGRSATPETLLEMACAAEVSGQPAVRDALLDELLKRDPENEKARWLAGQMRNGNRWATAGEVEESRSNDDLLREYVHRRENCGEDALSRLRLANWCRDHGMPDREKLHLVEIVAGPGSPDPAVMARLGMVKFRGQWMAKEEVEEFRQLDEEERRLEKRWRPVFARWKSDLESGGEAASERLAEALKEMTELEALPLLEEMLSTHSEKAALAVVAYLDTQPAQEATESLVRHAVFSQFESVRAAAVDVLQKRPKYHYIPMLLAGMVDPLEIEVEYPFGNGGYRRITTVQRGPDYDVKAVNHMSNYVTHSRVSSSTVLSRRFLWWRSWFRRSTFTMDGWSAKVKPGHYVEKGTEKTALNEQIGKTLYQLTGESYRNPEEWRTWWDDYTEYERQGERPTYEHHMHRHFWAYSLRTSSQMRTMSCLAWGTPVATETGLRPVEQILPGDKVLAQDPDTGELEYKIVLYRTVRRLGEMRKISMGDDSITVTLGHPFWVVGEGWQMAKELEVGRRIRCLDGSLAVTAIEELPEDVAYNLVVDGFATYFAGTSRVLLHDNTMPEPTAAILPGYVAGR